ncbi:hypothetical protein N9U05_00165, partial [bacterium]|nr:hypothetical protein [bacterium]
VVVVDYLVIDYLVRLFYKLCFWVHFRYKNGGCIENDDHAVSGPSGAPDCRDFFVSRCRITPVPLGPGRSGSDRRAFYRVTGADLANLANLRLRAEAQYSSALLHSPRPLLMTQVSTSEVKCGRPPSLQQKVAAVCIFGLIRDRRVGAAK